MSGVIRVENVTKSFGKRKALDNLSLKIEKNQVCALLGPNGAGKTTLVNILCGLLPFEGGHVSICGLEPVSHINEIRKKIGLVTQETALYEYLTAEENLLFHARFYNVPRSVRAQVISEALHLAQLEERRRDKVHTFSGGMKRRLALVRALLHDPDIIILDEPTLGIDVQNRNEIWNRILELKEEKTVLLATNYMDEADRLADVCAIMDHGALIAVDSPGTLKAVYAGGVRLEAYVISSAKDIETLRVHLLRISPGLHIEPELDSVYHITMPAQKAVNELLTEVSHIFRAFPQIQLNDLGVRIPTLDDVFLELTGVTLRD